MKYYFTFSKNQRIGVVTVALIIIVQIIVLNTNYAIGLPDPFVLDDSQYLIEENIIDNHKSDGLEEVKVSVISNFDPNQQSLKDWVDLGFSEKQAESILKYKTTIGGFKQKEDLKKAYVISDSKYKELEPYIQIEQALSEKKSATTQMDYVEIQKEPIELNNATKSDLIEIKGIANFTAEGILEHKINLGGFHSVNQLSEVYGISPENLELIKPQVEIDSKNIKKLNVNDLSISELKSHPYISWDTAKAIVDQRFKTNGGLQNLNFLVEQKLFDNEELKMLLPYIEY